MTRVVVQRGGLSNQPQSRQSSNSASKSSNPPPPSADDVSDVEVSNGDGESYARVVGGSGKEVLDPGTGIEEQFQHALELESPPEEEKEELLPPSRRSKAPSPSSMPVPTSQPVSPVATDLRTSEENDRGRMPSSSFSPTTAAAPSLRSRWLGGSNSGRASRRFSVLLKARSSPTGSWPTSPRSYGEGDGYNSADEQSPWTAAGPSGYKDGAERER